MPALDLVTDDGADPGQVQKFRDAGVEAEVVTAGAARGSRLNRPSKPWGPSDGQVIDCHRTALADRDAPAA